MRLAGLPGASAEDQYRRRQCRESRASDPVEAGTELFVALADHVAVGVAGVPLGGFLGGGPPGENLHGVSLVWSGNCRRADEAGQEYGAGKGALAPRMHSTKPCPAPGWEALAIQALTVTPTVVAAGSTVVCMDNRNEVRELLASRRAKLTPEQAGLPNFGGVRRVPGLRREEDALLAGVSIDYYTRVERGSLAGVSDTVLESIVRALRLDEAEREHLFRGCQIVCVGEL
jgi:hypothetical protein